MTPPWPSLLPTISKFTSTFWLTSSFLSIFSFNWHHRLGLLLLVVCGTTLQTRWGCHLWRFPLKRQSWYQPPAWYMTYSNSYHIPHPWVIAEANTAPMYDSEELESESTLSLPHRTAAILGRWNLYYSISVVFSWVSFFKFIEHGYTLTPNLDPTLPRALIRTCDSSDYQ